MPVSGKMKWVARGLLCSILLMLFSFFIHYPLPLRLISFAALMLVAYIIGQSAGSYRVRDMIFGCAKSGHTFLFIILGIVAGISLAILYRWYLGIRLFPGSIHYFLAVAALIGFTEELVFRGFIQGYIQYANKTLAIFFGAFSHTGYKCLLFLSPFLNPEVDLLNLGLWTFGAGIILGAMRHFSGNIAAPAAAHVLFDIIVYAEFIKAPWWVW